MNANQQRSQAEINEGRKRMGVMLLFLGILFGLIIIYKVAIHFIIKHAIAGQSHVVTVSSMTVGTALWQPHLSSVGSVRAIKGVNVTTELAGMVSTIFFEPGAIVKRGTILVELNIDADVALLHALQATEALDLITYNRDKKQFEATAISKEQLDTDAANLKNMQAQVAQQAATVAKKIIQAPFDGRLVISDVNPGQYLNPGDKVVTLQQLDPIYVDFYLPQQTLSQIELGQTVNVVTDTFPDSTFTGKITTIDPIVATDSRNVEVEVTVANTKLQLIPGMFADVKIDTHKPRDYITVPQTAISFNPYGNIVYVISKTKDKNNKDQLTVKQRFVTTGETRGDQVTVLKGLKAGEVIVTSGQLKLKNNDAVAINNAIQPADNPDPALSNEHKD
jgi:membrane fusion protein (multidrug efflux system)